MPGLPFHKMHGLGNDFVVVDARRAPAPLTAEQVRRVADRRRGVGFDQLVRVEAGGPAADARLAFLNPDGGEAGACGNGARCVARWLMDEAGRDELRLDTAGGPLRAWRAPGGGGAVTVAMAVPRLGWRDVPVAGPCDTLAMPVDVPGLPRPVGVSMGNPHAVFLVPDLGALDVAGLGAALERHPFFPERANVGFAQRLAPGRLRLRVFERGAGLTPACGSGACAAVVAAVRRGLAAAGAAVALELDGGGLEVAWEGEGRPVLATGPTAAAFSGVLSAELLDG